MSTLIPDFNPPAPGGVGRINEEEYADLTHFNPPAPGGAGLAARRRTVHGQRFQSTRPGWGGTPFPASWRAAIAISIHPPRVGRDSKSAQIQGCDLSALYKVLLGNLPVWPCRGALAVEWAGVSLDFGVRTSRGKPVCFPFAPIPSAPPLAHRMLLFQNVLLSPDIYYQDNKTGGCLSPCPSEKSACAKAPCTGQRPPRTRRRSSVPAGRS